MGNKASTYEEVLPEPAALPGTPEDIAALQEKVAVHLPGSELYAVHRWKGSFLLDPESFGRPSAIAVPTTAEQVSAIVKFVSTTGVRLCVACGRHTHESVVQDALMVDLSNGMNNVSVDMVANVITVQGGATIGQVDAACAPHKVILPMGRVESTGCAGQMMTTGARGYAERWLGLGLDYMIGATVVLASGEIVQCSTQEKADLFWGVRGGAHQFGIVTEMTFRAVESPTGGQFASGQNVFLNAGTFGMPTRQKVLDKLVEYMDESRPQEYAVSSVFVGGGAFNPSIITHMWFGDDTDQGIKYIKENCKKPGVAVMDNTGIHDYWTEIQKWSNGPKGENARPGAYYQKFVAIDRFTPEMAKILASGLQLSLPKGLECIALIDLMGGKALDSPDIEDMALPSRCKGWIVLLAQWKPPQGRDFAVQWVRDLWIKLNALAGVCHVSSGHLPEILEQSAGTEEERAQRRRDAWGDKTGRMIECKTRYDPRNLFGCSIEGFVAAP